MKHALYASLPDHTLREEHTRAQQDAGLAGFALEQARRRRKRALRDIIALEGEMLDRGIDFKPRDS